MKKLRISAWHSHLAFGLIQSAITCAVAAGIASMPFLETGSFAVYWAKTWATSWVSMLPVVIFGAPFIRALVDRLVCYSASPIHSQDCQNEIQKPGHSAS
jgi:Protein of unknown function (DUF2798)